MTTEEQRQHWRIGNLYSRVGKAVYVLSLRCEWCGEHTKPMVVRSDWVCCQRCLYVRADEIRAKEHSDAISE